MKRVILLSMLLLASVACSITGTVNQNPAPEIEGSDLPQTSSLPTQPSITQTHVEEVVFSDGEMKWSLLYNPPNVERYHPSGLFETFLGGGTIPILPGKFNNNDYQTLHPKGYAYDQQTVYLPSDLMRVTAVDLDSGMINWQSEMSGYVIGLGENTVFVYRDDNRLYGLDKSNGEEKWHIILNALVSDGELADPYLITINHMDTAIVPIRITKKFPAGYSLSFMYVNESTGNNYLIATNPEIAETVIPIAFIDGMVIATSEYDLYYYGINVDDGSIRWAIGDQYDDYFHLDIAAFDPDANILYLNPRYTASYNADLIALDVLTGNMIWEGSLAEMNGIRSSEFTPGLGSSNLYVTRDYVVSVYDNEVLVFQKEDGGLINTITPDRSFKAFISDSGMVLYYKDLRVYKGIDYVTGKELWQEDELTIYGWPFSSWYVDDIIMLRDDVNDLFAINQKTGDYLWSLDIHGDQTFALYEDDMIYYDGKNLIFHNLHTGDTQEIFIDKYGYMLGNGGHIEILDDSSWLLCGVYLTRVSIR